MTINVIDWLNRRHTVFELLQLTQGQIVSIQAACDSVDNANMTRWRQLETARKEKVQSFKIEHPRSKPPSHLTRASKMPALLREKFDKLLKRRDAALRKEKQERQERREVFLSRMKSGKERALQQRYDEALSMTEQLAKVLNVPLTTKHLNEQLKEILERIS